MHEQRERLVEGVSNNNRTRFPQDRTGAQHTITHARPILGAFRRRLAYPGRLASVAMLIRLLIASRPYTGARPPSGNRLSAEMSVKVPVSCSGSNFFP